jgi:hypothetical protein
MWLEEGVRSSTAERIGKRAYFLKCHLFAALEALHSSDLPLCLDDVIKQLFRSLFSVSRLRGEMIYFHSCQEPLSQTGA